MQTKTYISSFTRVMKKSSAILLLAAFHLVVSTGLCISVHYCGGKFKSLSFLATINKTENCCCGIKKKCCGSKKKSKGCCKQKTTFIKVNEVHKSTNLLKAPVCLITLTNPTLWILKLNYSSTNTNSYTFHKPPSLLYFPPLYLNYGVLLI